MCAAPTWRSPACDGRREASASSPRTPCWRPCPAGTPIGSPPPRRGSSPTVRRRVPTYSSVSTWHSERPQRQPHGRDRTARRVVPAMGAVSAEVQRISLVEGELLTVDLDLERPVEHEDQL